MIFLSAFVLAVSVAAVLRTCVATEESPAADAKRLVADLADTKRGLAAENALHIMGPAAVPALTEALSNPQPDIRRLAVGVLERIGDRATLPIEEITRLTNDEDDGVRRQAIHALGSIGRNAIASTNALRRALTARIELERQYAAVSLWKVSGNIGDTVPVLTNLLPIVEPYQQEQIVAAFQEMGTNALAAVPALINGTMSKYSELRFSSAKALWVITRDPARALPTLKGILDRPSDRYKVVTLDLLAEMGPAAKEATSSISRCLHDTDSRVRRSAQSALDQISASR